MMSLEETTSEEDTIDFVKYLQRNYMSEFNGYMEYLDEKEKGRKSPARDLSSEEREQEIEDREQQREKKRKDIEPEKGRLRKEEVETPGSQEPVTKYERAEQDVIDVQEKDLKTKTERIKELKEELKRREKEKGKKGAVMRRTSDAGPGPQSYNAPGKDDKKDYDHKERNRQPARNRNKFTVNRMFSTTSSDDNGYVMMDIGWDPKLFENMSPQNVQHQVISFIKGLESDKYYHDFGIMGKPKIIEFDEDAGVAQIKVRCSESRGIMTLTYGSDLKDDVLPLKGIR